MQAVMIDLLLEAKYSHSKSSCLPPSSPHTHGVKLLHLAVRETL